MDGLIVRQPFARRLVNGQKKIEYRSSKLPRMKRNRRIYILTTVDAGQEILGSVSFTKCIGDTNNGFEWHVESPRKFNKPRKYIPKAGAIVWINDVEVIRNG